MALDSIAASVNMGQAKKVMDNIGKQAEMFGRVGSVIKGTVSGIGEEASVMIGDHRITVSKELVNGCRVGDEMEFLVEDTNGKSVALKALQNCAGIATEDSVLKSMSNTKVVRDTKQFVNILRESEFNISIADEVEENTKKVSRLSSDDLRMLRQMGIDVTNSDLSHLMGLVNQYHAQQEGRTFVTASAEVAQAIKEAQNMSRIQDGTLKYMMDNNMEFTYANVYKAEYSAADYPVSELSEEQWQQWKPRIEERMKNTQIPITDANLEAGRWMLTHNCDMTPENYSLYEKVQKFNQEGLDVSQYEQNVQQQLQVKEAWQSAPLEGDSMVAKAQQLVEAFAKTTNQELDTLMAQGRPLTIGNLIAAGQEQLKELQGISQAEVSKIDHQAAIMSKQTSDENSARYLQLQEIRLRLTVQSGYRMMRMGIDIESLEMHNLIEELDQLESQQTKSLLQEEHVDATTENIHLYQQTMALTRAIPGLPSDTLGAVVADEAGITIEMVVQHGSRIAGNYYRFGVNGYETISGQIASYEQVMTMPRADMGDRISKAFANMDSMLMEMNMELSDENRKAVRILVYNQMEITHNNIDEIKTLDNRLMNIVQDMTPEVVLGMIRDGMRPLKMNLDELEHAIAVQKEKTGDTEEKRFSEFLYSLDKKGEITTEERASYIGIYKLLNRITSYSDRDLGALVKSGQEITLDNLLTSYYSRKKVGTEVTIDSEFGMLEHITSGNASIKEQIESGYDYIKDVLQNKTEQEEQELQQQLEEDMGALARVEKDAIQLINALEQPCHPSNLMAAQSLLENTGAFYQNIAMELEQRGVATKDIQTLNEQLEQSLLSYLGEIDGQETSVTGAASMQEAGTDADVLQNVEDRTEAETLQGKTEHKVSSPVDDYINRMDALLIQAESSSLTAKSLSAMKQVHTMLRMTRQLCREQQYLVPIALAQEVLTMSVSVVQKGEEPKMELQVEAESYGMVHAEVSMNEEGAAVWLSGSNEVVTQMLTETKETFAQSLLEQNIAVASITINNDENAYESRSLISEWATQTRDNKPERNVAAAFYQVAKSMIQIVRNWG